MRRLLRTSTSSDFGELSRAVVSWTFNLAALASAVLLVGVCVLWVRSYWVADLLWTEGRHPEWPGRTTLLIVSGHGKVRVDSSWVLGDPEKAYFYRPPGRDWKYEREAPGSVARHLNGPLSFDKYHDGPYGERFSRLFDIRERGGWSIRIPDWLPFAMTTVLPAIRVVQSLRRIRKTRHACCVGCGYDLRATPNRCPECGLVPGNGGQPPS